MSGRDVRNCKKRKNVFELEGTSEPGEYDRIMTTSKAQLKLVVISLKRNKSA